MYIISSCYDYYDCTFDGLLAHSVGGLIRGGMFVGLLLRRLYLVVVLFSDTACNGPPQHRCFVYRASSLCTTNVSVDDVLNPGN